MPLRLDEFKTRQRAVWAAGDYAAFSDRIADVGELVVERAAIEHGMRVLDVACGTGNTTIPAARAGARVTGLDLAPKLLDQGRAKAEAAGLEIKWVEGDAEELPFEDHSFDRVRALGRIRPCPSRARARLRARDGGRRGRGTAGGRGDGQAVAERIPGAFLAHACV